MIDPLLVRLRLLAQGLVGSAAATPRGIRRADVFAVWDEACLTCADLDAIHLLPGFDEVVLGYPDRLVLLPEEHHGHVVPGLTAPVVPPAPVTGPGSRHLRWRCVKPRRQGSPSWLPPSRRAAIRPG